MRKRAGMIGSLFLLVLVLGCGERARQEKPPAVEPGIAEEIELEKALEKEVKEMAPPIGKKVVMIIASREFRDEELLKPKEVLEKAGFTVTVASSSLGTAVGMLGAKVKPDMLFTDIKVADYDAILFIGGMGASEYWDNATAHKLAQDAVAQGKLLGAICIAPVTLAKAGVLSGKKATVWYSERGKLTAAGANCTGSNVEIDGKIITADGPASAEAFGKAIVNALSPK